MIASCSAVGGCGGRPHAPPLKDEPVYQNSKEGFRFLVPEGWTQVARAEVPPGEATQELMLVEYKLLNAERPAGLSITLIDLPESSDLVTHLCGPALGSESWRLQRAPESMSLNGAPAQRFCLTNSNAKDASMREVVVFRRGGRVYLFTGIFAMSDARAAAEVRRAVESVVWKS
jgi:hypothetical protein